MRFAIKTAPQNTSWEEMLRVWQAADEIELYESAWTFDHSWTEPQAAHDACAEWAEAGMDLAICYLAPPHVPDHLEAVADALRPLEG